MSDVSNLNLVSLTRRAERERKELAKKDKKKKKLEILNEIAESKEFNTWNALRKKRLEYCQSVVIKDNSPTTLSIFIIGYGFKGRQGRINRLEGSLLLLSYVTYTIFLFI